MKNHPTIIWAALLVRCEGSFLDLSSADEESQECAKQMAETGLLQTDEDGCYTLTSTGMSLLTLVERLRDFSLGK